MNCAAEVCSKSAVPKLRLSSAKIQSYDSVAPKSEVTTRFGKNPKLRLGSAKIQSYDSVRQKSKVTIRFAKNLKLRLGWAKI